ncbi:MAG: DUF418 domain-containing protein [Pikeienuella sp.]
MSSVLQNNKRIAKPDAKSTRLDGLDFARFVAFVGMVLVNFHIVLAPTAEGGISSIFEGKAAASFVVLAGLGLGLAAKQMDMRRIVPLTIMRALFLLVIGLANTLIFDADILHYYAFYFLVCALLFRSRTTVLFTAIFAINVLYVGLMLVLDYDAGWDWATYTYTDFWTVEGFFRNLLFNGWHPLLPWSSFMLIGFWLARIRLFKIRVQNRLIIIGGGLIIVAEIISAALSYPLALVAPELLDMAKTSPIPPGPLYIVSGIGAACLLTGLCLRFSQILTRAGLIAFFAPAGRMTLTLYIAHIYIGMGLMEELGLIGVGTGDQAVTWSISFCAAAAIGAFLWSRRFKRGPLESLMRKISG